MKRATILMTTAALAALSAGLLGCSRAATAEPTASSSPSLLSGAGEVAQLRGAGPWSDGSVRQWAVVTPRGSVAVKVGQYVYFGDVASGVTDPSQITLTSNNEHALVVAVRPADDGTVVPYGVALSYGVATVSATTPHGTATFQVAVEP